MKLSLHLLICLVFILNASIRAQSETEKGVELYRSDDYDGAIAVLENVVKTNPKDRTAWVYLGASFVRKGKDKEATKALRTADDIFITEPPTDVSEQIKVISRPRPNTFGVSKEERTSGRINFAVEFKADGKIGFVFPISKSLSYELTKNATEAARGIKFKPAQKNKKPITVVKFVEYTFIFF